MREIKFRAWDKYENEMISFSDLCDQDDLNWGLLFKGRYHNLKAMQFTGLRDKNGTEIYESDVLALDGDVWCQVSWDDGSFQVIASKTQGRSPLIQERAKRFEVIGNIHENPELLK